MDLHAVSDEDLDRLLAADQHFAFALELAEPFFEEEYLDAARQILNDIAIRVVGGHYRPEAVAQVRAQRPSLHRAGLRYLLDRWRDPIPQYQIPVHPPSGVLRAARPKQPVRPHHLTSAYQCSRLKACEPPSPWTMTCTRPPSTSPTRPVSGSERFSRPLPAAA